MWLVKNYQTLYEIFLIRMYHMVDISKKTHENNDIEVIVDDIDMPWLNEKHIEEKLGHKNLPATTSKYDPVHRKYRYELVIRPKTQPEDFYVVMWH